MRVKKSRSAFAAVIALLAMAIGVGSLLPIRSTACGESVYSFAWGLHACEYRAEAGVDFYCNARIGGWREYVQWGELSEAECRTRQELYCVPLIHRLGVLS